MPLANSAARAGTVRLFGGGQYFAPVLVGYTLFGVGNIGYTTVVVALLKEQGASPHDVTAFYALLGVSVMAASRIWASMLDRFQGGQALTILSALLGVATVLPAFTASWPPMLVSGAMFSGVFLSVVASTTALVRYNLPQNQWAAGISAFTVVFAAGQIIGTLAAGWIVDSPCSPPDIAARASRDRVGLQQGLIFLAFALWLGALIAMS